MLAAQFESFVHPITIMSSMFLAIPFGLITLVWLGISLNICHRAWDLLHPSRWGGLAWERTRLAGSRRGP